MGKFTSSNVDQAIKEVNFTKGIGMDMFDGTCLLNVKIKENFTSWMLDVLNGIEEIPEYFIQNRLLLFSKTNSPETTLDKIRPISVESHICKVYERAIKNKIKELDSDLFKV